MYLTKTIRERYPVFEKSDGVTVNMDLGKRLNSGVRETVCLIIDFPNLN